MTDLPNTRLTKWDRNDGVQSFSLSASSASKLYGAVTVVYYHVEHDREDVLRRLLNMNPGVIEDQSFRDFQRLLAHETCGWKGPCREIRGEFFDGEEGKQYESLSTAGYESDRECPNCGTDVLFNGLPAHLRGGCESAASLGERLILDDSEKTPHRRGGRQGGRYLHASEPLHATHNSTEPHLPHNDFVYICSG